MRRASEASVAARSRARTADGASIARPSSSMAPVGSYPVPDRSRTRSSANTRRTVISFFVSVPVLSEQITDVLPSVSTIGRRRTRALRLTIRRTPMASEIVTTAGSASGTTATASAIPNMNISSAGRPRARPITTTSATTMRAAFASVPPRRSRFSWRGVRPASTVSTIRAIRPNSVDMPVATTTAWPRPWTTSVPAYVMFLRSPSARPGSSNAVAVLLAAADSPVSAASSTARLTASMTRVSAGTRSPARSITTSPGTRSRAGMADSSPSRSTCADGAAILRSASSALPARCSWMKPRSTANSTMTVMTTASSVWPRKPETTVALRRITISAFWNCAKKVCHADCVRSVCSSFAPCTARRSTAAAAVSPVGCVASRASTESADSVCQAGAVSNVCSIVLCSVTRIRRGRREPGEDDGSAEWLAARSA